MNDITAKQISLRNASAEGFVYCSKETLDRVRANDLPKEDLYGMARAAAMLGAKRTSDLIPHCHPVSIDGMEISIDTQDSPPAVKVSVSARSIGRTGIEMEALTAVSVASLVIYDHLKPIDKDLRISDVRLLEKTGGKSDARLKRYAAGASAAILICSDSVAAGKKEDGAGVAIAEVLSKFEVTIKETVVVEDVADAIRKAVQGWVGAVDLIVTTGGTGLGPRDVTTNAIREILEEEIPGVAEAMRAFGQDRTPFAMLSRSLAGKIGNTIVVCLPGSTNGARESMQAICPGIFHALPMMQGQGH